MYPYSLKRQRALRVVISILVFINVVSSLLTRCRVKTQIAVKRNQKLESDGVSWRLQVMPHRDGREKIAVLPQKRGRARRKPRYVVGRSKWHKKRLRYQVLNVTPDLPRSLVLQTLQEAFDKWANATNLVFVRVSPKSRDADITIRFVPAGYHGDEQSFAKGPKEELIGHSFPPWNNTGRSGDIHFNDDKYFSLPGHARAAYDLLWIAMHEIGHSLGLKDTGNPMAVMYVSYMAYFYRGDRSLGDDDIRGIQALYGAPQPPGIPNECGMTSMDAMVTTADRMTYLFAGAFFWVMSDRGPTSNALRIRKFWNGLEDGIDAAFTRQSDGMTFILKGSRFWMFRNRARIEGPLPFTHPELNITNLTNITAALESTNHKTVFLFKGSNYWRYRPDQRRLFEETPRRIKRGLPANPDAAIRWYNGKGYLFKNDDYYRLKGRGVRKASGYPRGLHDNWLACGDIRTQLNPVIRP